MLLARDRSRSFLVQADHEGKAGLPSPSATLGWQRKRARRSSRLVLPSSVGIRHTVRSRSCHIGRILKYCYLCRGMEGNSIFTVPHHLFADTSKRHSALLCEMDWGVLQVCAAATELEVREEEAISGPSFQGVPQM